MKISFLLLLITLLIAKHLDISTPDQLENVIFSSILHPGNGGAINVNCDGEISIKGSSFFECISYIENGLV
jgi:hypothetical protein